MGVGGVFFLVIGIVLLIIGIILYKNALKKSSDLSVEKTELQKILLEKRDSEQKKQWAVEIKEQSVRLSRICEKSTLSEQPLVSTTYKANNQMDAILKALTRAAEIQGTVESIANELSEKGEAWK